MQTKMYEFRPFELQSCEYKGYSKARKGRGINFIPKPRSGHRVTASETDLFSFGGFNPNTESRLFPELLKFNFLTQKWSKVFTSQTHELPKQPVSNAIAFGNGLILVYGGTGYPFGDQSSNETYLMSPYHIKSAQRLFTSGDKPEELYGQAIILHDHFLYTIGGTSGLEFTCDVHRLDLNTHIWENLYMCNENIRNDPKGRYRHELGCDENFIYIFGGGTQERSFQLDILPAFNVHNKKFSFIQTKPDPMVTSNGGYPEARRFHSCIQNVTENGVEVIVCGGFKCEDLILDDIWKINLKTYQWQLFGQTKIPHPLYFHDAGAVGNGLMYLFGGVKGSSRLRINALYKMWTHIPKLSEISWDALTFYNPNIVNCNPIELVKIGVPRRFADRVHDSQLKL